MTFTGTPTDAAAAPLAQLRVTPYGTKYLAAASSDVLVAELAGAGWTAVEDVKLYRVVEFDVNEPQACFSFRGIRNIPEALRLSEAFLDFYPGSPTRNMDSAETGNMKRTR